MDKKQIKIAAILKTISLVLFLACLIQSCRLLKSRSGTLLVVELKTAEPNLEQVTESAVKILKNRLNALGTDGEIHKTSPNRIEIKIYGDADMQRVKDILLAESRFELRKVITPPSPSPMQTFPTKEAAIQSLGGTIPSNRKVLKYAELRTNTEAWVIVEDPSIVDGRELRDASAYPDSGKSGNYVIGFSLNSEGAQKFGDWTGKNINSYLAIVLNDEVKSAAYIRSQIFDQGQIDGRFTKRSAEDLALVMKSGYLPANLLLIDEKRFE